MQLLEPKPGAFLLKAENAPEQNQPDWNREANQADAIARNQSLERFHSKLKRSRPKSATGAGRDMTNFRLGTRS
jgi:hypothetical protein